MRKDENEKESQYNVAKSELDILMSTEQKEQCKLEQLEQKYQSSTSGLGGKKVEIFQLLLSILKVTFNQIKSDI